MVYKQIKFIDQELLSIYGFSSISDYKTEISVNSVSKIKDHLTNLNSIMDKILEFFKVGTLNLSRKKYQVDSVKLSMALLRNLLQQANIPFIVNHKSSGNVMRLIPINLTLMNYINHKNLKDIDHVMPNQADSSIDINKLFNTDQQIYGNPDSEQERVLESCTEMEDNREVIYQLVETTKSAKNRTCKFSNLTLFNIKSPVKKLTLLNLPEKYTYKLYFNSHLAGRSSLIDGKQVFDFEKMNKNTDNKGNLLEDISIWRDATRGSYYDCLSNSEKKIYIEFGRIDNIFIDVEVNDPYDSFHIYNKVEKKFLQDEYQIEVEGLEIVDQINKTKSYYRQVYKYYPNWSYRLMINLAVSKIWINPAVGMTASLWLDTRKVYLNSGQIDFSQWNNPYKQATHGGSFYDFVTDHFKNSVDKMENGTIFASRIDDIVLVCQPTSSNVDDINKVPEINYTMYNIRNILEKKTWNWRFIE